AATGSLLPSIHSPASGPPTSPASHAHGTGAMTTVLAKTSGRTLPPVSPHTEPPHAHAPDDEIPVPLGYIQPDMSRPKGPARKDFAAPQPPDRPETSYMPRRLSGTPNSTNLGDLEIEAAAQTAVAPVAASSWLQSRQPPLWAWHLCKPPPGAVMATEDMLAMKSIRIVGGPPRSEEDINTASTAPEELGMQLPAPKLVTAADAMALPIAAASVYSQHTND
ncbi:hypothetical protein HaLaN_19193, partial [Haematococcus lacustris]